MKEDKYSYTAEGSAGMRALGTFEKDTTLKNRDYLANKLLGRRMRFLLKNGLIRKAALQYYGSRLPGLYEAHLSRSHHFDKTVKEELTGGAQQYVILGAGLDSRPYRFSDLIENCRVFEIDHPATSKFKRDRLDQAGVERTHVTFLEVDFEKETAQQGLLASGFDKSRRSVFTWEGVIMYLNEQAVSSMFEFVGTLPSQSSIVFDYFFEDVIIDPGRFPEAKKHLDYVEKRQEPYTFGINLDKTGEYVSRKGLELVSNYGPEEINSHYLANHNRGVNAWYGMAHARVP